MFVGSVEVRSSNFGQAIMLLSFVCLIESLSYIPMDEKMFDIFLIGK